MEIIKGGFALTQDDEITLNRQRAITAKVNNDFIQVGATFLKMSGKNPYTPDWHRRKFRDTNLQDWIDNPEFRELNLGFNLQLGWLDVDIDSTDVRYNESIIKALKFLGVDTRFAFGRVSRGIPSHLLVQLNEADVINYDAMKEFEPKEFRIKDKRYKTELRSMGPMDDSPNVIKQARQTVMPGSVYNHSTTPGSYDISVWYTDKNVVALSVDNIATTTSRKVSFSTLISGIAFGTFLYVVQPHWVEGNRQGTAIKIAGWLARIVTESSGINVNEGTSQGTFCPIDRAEAAESMLDFVCAELGDPEGGMRKRTFRDALKKLENNPDAKIPGWPALEGEIGTESVMALRAVFMPGVDVSPLTQMADRYVYDESDDVYIDRDRFLSPLNFIHDGGQLERRHKQDLMEIAGKKKPVFKIFESSLLRRRVGGRNLHPELPPGSVFRMNTEGSIIPDEQDGDPGTVTIFNTWRGWPIPPTETLDKDLLAKCDRMLNQLLHYLTQNNEKQTEWLKQWIAWTVQHPGNKQQIAPVFVGGQGVGKSFFGNVFMGEMFRSLWGTASPRILEGAFSVEPFINKMFVFIDEAKFHSEASTDEIKKLIRSDKIGGAEKFKSAQTHNIFSRVIFASNRWDMNIGQQNMQDRALFYMKTYDKDYMEKSERDFILWTNTLKPFFDEFNTMLQLIEVKRHYMYLFSTMDTNRVDVESIAESSGNDVRIVTSNMAYPRQVAKRIIEEGRIWEDLDISAPFTQNELDKRIKDTCETMGIRVIQTRYILQEFTDAGVIGKWHSGTQILWRFKYKIATLTENFEKAIGVGLEPRFLFDDEDRGDNDTEMNNAKTWKGMNTRFRNGI